MAKIQKPVDMRVRIARDILARIDAGGGPQYSHLGYLNIPPATTTRRQLIDRQAECTVCALGGMFIAAHSVGAFPGVADEHFRLTYMNHRQLVDRNLEPIFGVDNLRLIETAYECAKFDRNSVMPSTRYEAAKAFGARYYDSAERMRAIMENVIANGGVFKP